MTQQPTRAQLEAMNMQARAAVIGAAVPMMQQFYSENLGTLTNGTPIVRNIPIKNVGLVRRLYIDVTATVTQGAAETQNRTTFGPANLLSNITFADYSNYQRINTTGWHLDKIATVKNRAAYGAAFTSDTPNGYGSNFNVINAASAITTVQTIRQIYEVPFAYSDMDLTGAVLANVINANAYIQFTVNPNFFVTSSGNPVQAGYQSTTAQLGVLGNITVKIYQDYLDQLPVQGGALVLPVIDLSTVYGIYNTQLTGLAANSDNPVNYTNYRRFMSTLCVYDNAGVLNTGSDVNAFKLQSANMTNIFDLPPRMIQLLTRKAIMDDMPAGTYYFDHRAKPIDTVVNGNMQLLFNPSAVTGATSQLLVGFEYLALLNQVAQAGSVLQ